MKNCMLKETEKLWEFSSEKSPWMCISNRKKNIEDIEVEVAQGKLVRTIVHKFLGNYMNEKGNLDDQLKYMESKVGGLVSEANKICCQKKLGVYEWDGKKTVYEAQIIPAVFHNIEAWTNLRKTDWERMESLQGKILRGLFGLPKSTPYWGLLYELNVIPIRLHITYKRLMVYHNLINSDDDRVAKQIIKEQEKDGYEECWFGNVKREGKSIGIEVNEEAVLGKQKSVWKKQVKEKIRVAFEAEMTVKKQHGVKLRFLGNRGSDTYLKEVCNENARMAMKIRLNMVDWIQKNFGVEGVCPLCGEEDSTEHVFACDGGLGLGVSVKDLEDGMKMDKIIELFKKTETKRREKLLELI